MTNQKTTVGDSIKRFRTEKGLSLEALVQSSGLPATTITAIEEHETTPPLGQIVALASALNVSIGDLMDHSANAPFSITRNNGGPIVSRFGETSANYSYESLCGSKQNRQMEPFLVSLAPGNDPLEANQHVGEEILYILEGQVEVSLSGHVDILNPGDTICYDSTLPHIVRCHGDKPARLFAVIYAKKDLFLV
ncbi:MAG: cupin domain-containing protein [Phycisphaerae bacterium]|nr:cupin domain-containing protein [Phycisphaerae bacterium]NIW22127.1 cupin domain-containing protein [candidate division KSB1 bacterium]NIV02382.1 cupin domain-containing protein [Phycisphaerae bacterium]NIV69412.1 cupin domain-containing protein [Phycisphaerae bacterium]NIW72672.1 cupin domain-containing protein [candidate division KSB1 bacterium]